MFSAKQGRLAHMRSTKTALAVVLAGLLLASSVAHGQSSGIDPKVHRNYTPYSEAFYRELMTGRVNLFEGIGRFRNVVQGQVFGSDGTVVACAAYPRPGKGVGWVGRTSKRWSLIRNSQAGVRTEWDYGGGRKRYASKFYEPESGAFSNEILYQGSYILANPGQIQDTWPRALADACPDLKLPAHIRINEKQTSLRMDELRRQDPDAPIRNFPGSHLTGPGRTGLGASGGRPTTTKEEVWAFLDAQEGNVLLSPDGWGRIFVRGPGDRHEVWGLKDNGEFAWVAGLISFEEGGGDWLGWELEGKIVARYPMGYPFPYLPTGHRHAAFQLTDEFIGRPHPRSLPFMGEAYADRRFVFHPEGKFSVVDEAGNLVEGPHFEGGWRWTQGRLEMSVTDDPAGPRSIGWRELADQLGMKPTVWTPSTPDRY